MEIIIPAANKKHNKIRINGKNIVKNNLDLVISHFPKSNRYIVLDENDTKYSGKAKVIENVDYNKSSSVKSIRLAIENSKKNKCLIIHGNLKISKKIFKFVDFKQSFVMCTSSTEKGKIGLNVDKDNLTHLEYGLQRQYFNIVFLRDKELSIFKNILSNQNRDKHKLYEIINEVIDFGGKVKVFEVKNDYIKEY